MKKILMIASCNFLVNPNDGGRQCSYRNYSALCRVFGKENVHVCMISNDKMEKQDNIFLLPAYENRMQQVLWAMRSRVGYSHKTEQQILQIANHGGYDYLWLDRSTLGKFCGLLETKAEIITFFHNIEVTYIKNKMLHENVGYAISYMAFWLNERKAVKESNKIICLNKRDSKLLYDIYGRRADYLLPISFEDVLKKKNLPVSKFTSEITRTLLFVGSFFQPNIEGTSWFLNNVMPKLAGIKLIIVGKGLEKKAPEWESGNVQVVGTVPDVSEYYLKADAVVLPIFYGAGMKVKTAEALMYGKVIFGTKEALEGYEKEGQPDIHECNTESEYIESIKKFYEVEKERAFSEANRKLFLDKYENTAIVRQLKMFFSN